MILIDALFINNGGGKILLDYLVEKIENEKINAFYLLDLRIIGSYTSIDDNRKTFIKASIFQRYKFYKKNHQNFEKVFCFGNLPPVKKLPIQSYTYFHNILFIKNPLNINSLSSFKLILKQIIFFALSNNSDFFIIQRESTKMRLAKYYGIVPEKILVKPFFPPISSDLVMDRKKNSFLYVSSGHKYKNHSLLFKAFCAFYRHHKKGILHVTIGNDFPELQKEIIDLTNKGFPIINLGFISREALSTIYLRNQYLIFPSLSESFGLGLIEAIHMGCKVIAADLPYTYEVCVPSLIFDPYSEDSINNAFTTATHKELPISKPLIKNEISEIIKFFK